jgi:hypothetical protein
MPIDNPEYDVAISFLTRDESVAAAFNRKLSEGLKVFFYPHQQEDLAGTDGLESMRRPFLEESRVMLVLYRGGWGKTPWTRVEETAIKDGCFNHGWERLFFVLLDKDAPLPVWLPKTHIHFTYSDFGLEQAVGAIRARVHENGGQTTPLTAIKRAEIYRADELFRCEKEQLKTIQAWPMIRDTITRLFHEIESRCKEISSKEFLRLRYSTRLEDTSRSGLSLIMTDDLVGIIINWYQPYLNVIDKSHLSVNEYNIGLILHDELSHRRYLTPPESMTETQYFPDLSIAREYGWRRNGTSEFISAGALAEQLVIRLLELATQKNNPASGGTFEVSW